MSKKIAALIVGILVVVGILAYVIGVPMWERAQEEKIRAALEKMPGNVTVEDVKVTFNGNKALLTDLKGHFELLPGLSYTVSIAKIEAVGLNLSSAKTDAVTTLADSLLITDMRFGSVFEEMGMTQEAVLREASFRDIKMNLGGLREALDKEDFGAAFAKLNTLHIGQVTYVDYVASTDFLLGPIVVSVASMEGKDIGILQSGPMKINDIRASLGEMELFTLKDIALARMVVPDFFSPLLGSLDNPDMLALQGAMVIQQKLRETPMVIEGLAFNGLSVKGPLQEPVTMDSFTLDFIFGGDKILFKNAVSNLVLSPALFEMLDREFVSFAKTYGKDLVLSGDANYVMEQKDGVVNILASGSAADKNLGNARMEAVFSYEAAMQQTLIDSLPFASPRFHSSSLGLTDSGILAVFFDAMYLNDSRWYEEGAGPASGADIRRQTVAEIREDASQATTPWQLAILNGLADFIEKGGKLDINVTASEPVSLEELVDPENPNQDRLTVTVERTDLQ